MQKSFFLNLKNKVNIIPTMRAATESSITEYFVVFMVLVCVKSLEERSF